MNGWTNKQFPFKDLVVFSAPLFRETLDNFWNGLDFPGNSHILITLRFIFSTGKVATIGKIQKLNNQDKELFYNYILNYIEILHESYIIDQIKSLVFSYGFREGITEITLIDLNQVTYQKYKTKNIPLTFNPLDYGLVLHQDNNTYIINGLNGLSYAIIHTPNIHNLVKAYKNTTEILSWKDIYVNENTFEREIGKSTYTIENSEIILHKTIKPAKYVVKAKAVRDLNYNIITMDIETIVCNNVITPYLLCWYDGNISKSYFITDYVNFDHLMKSVVKDIFIKKYDGYKIYFHNLSNFDGIFIYKILSNIYGMMVNPLMNNDKMINIECDYNNVTLQIRDSYLILTASLDKLSKSFNICNKKSFFPIYLNNIRYNGPVPDIKYFKDISLFEYNNYKTLNEGAYWSFKDESIKYCINDCIALHQILVKFNELIHNTFQVDINAYPTASSLSLGIYRTNYIPKNKIPVIIGDIYNDIKHAYTGGAMDMYIPSNKDGELVYGYDVNSLYPYIMSEKDMPIGNPTYFEGDILKSVDKPFGFFNVEVETPNDIKHPIIQLHHKTEKGIRTISPLGKFEMMIFSEEMYNAEDLGYKFKIKSGYLFKKANLFKDFIKDLYDMRLSYPKSDPMNYIAKLAMNSLYGRWGMKDSFSRLMCIDKNLFNTHSIFKENICQITELGNRLLIEVENDYTDILLDNGSISKNVSLPISAAISAYSRIHMSQYKNKDDIKLFYSDTDSLYINKPLPDYMVSDTELGKLKLESISKKAIFLAPKLYGLVSNDDDRVTLKIKGLKKERFNELSFNSLEELLYKNSMLEVNQEKWYKSLGEGNITIQDQLYTIKVTSNKRQLVYHKIFSGREKLIGTKAIYLSP